MAHLLPARILLPNGASRSDRGLTHWASVEPAGSDNFLPVRFDVTEAEGHNRVLVQPR